MKRCSYLLAEDTRVTKVLCSEYDITTPLRSYHSFSEKKYLQPILDDLTAGMEIGLVSDAGMPGISDPGNMLIKACRQQGIGVTVYPGPTACITALVSAGLGEHPFQFLGFFPQKMGRDEVVRSLFYQGVSIYYEAPHRILETLSLFPPETQLTIGRELTKKFEETRNGTARELHEHFQKNAPRGEFVLLVHGYKRVQTEPVAFVQELMDTFSIDQKKALKLACEVLDIPKRELYKLCHDIPS